MEREEELSVICLKVVVKGNGRGQSTKRGSVHDKETTENTTKGSMQGIEVVITFNTKEER